MTINTTAESAREAAREGDGKFGTQLHSEPAGLSLGIPQPTVYRVPLAGYSDRHVFPSDLEELPAWPEGLPEPKVGYSFNDGVETHVQIGDSTLRFRSFGDESYNSVVAGDDPLDGLDDEDAEAVVEWGRIVHEKIDAAVSGVAMDAASTQEAQEMIVAAATGKPVPAGPDLTNKLIRRQVSDALEDRMDRLKQELQKTYLVGVAQKLREKHPNVHSFVLSGNGEYAKLQSAMTADGDEIDETTLELISDEIFDYRDEDDFNTLMGDDITVDEALAFRPSL